MASMRVNSYTVRRMAGGIAMIIALPYGGLCIVHAVSRATYNYKPINGPQRALGLYGRRHTCCRKRIQT